VRYVFVFLAPPAGRFMHCLPCVVSMYVLVDFEFSYVFVHIFLVIGNNGNNVKTDDLTVLIFYL